MKEGLPKKPDMRLGIYEHYKGNRYKVVCLALHSEELEWHVLYKPQYDAEVDTWVRPHDLFMGLVEVDGSVVPRFKFIESA